MLAFDIETAVDPSRIAEIPEPEVALGNLVDPVKISAKREAAKAKVIEQAALDPFYSRVLCLCTAWREKDGTIGYGLNADDDEQRRLELFWNEVATEKSLVTFNGSAFDLPFLYRRSLILGVPTRKIDMHQYRTAEPGGQHLDVCRLLATTDVGNSHPGNQHFYAKSLLGRTSPHPDLDKSRLGEIWQTPNGRRQIIEECTWDAETTLLLAEKLIPIYG